MTIVLPPTPEGLGFSEIQPVCHFTPMEFQGGEYGASWWECEHCGHTKEETPEDPGER